jgi:hypothetical protein
LNTKGGDSKHEMDTTRPLKYNEDLTLGKNSEEKKMMKKNIRKYITISSKTIQNIFFVINHYAACFLSLWKRVIIKSSSRHELSA